MQINKNKIKHVTAIGIVVVAMVISICFILAKPVDKNNTTLVSGHYAGLEKVIARGDVSYDLYTLENRDGYYKIAADNSHCFYPNGFQNAVKIGQPIQIYLQKTFFRKPMIVAIISSGTEYFSFTCANEEIKSEKTEMPIILMAVALLICALIYGKIKKGH